MMKMINRTKAKSNSGVTLISVNVCMAGRSEYRRITKLGPSNQFHDARPRPAEPQPQTKNLTPRPEDIQNLTAKAAKATKRGFLSEIFATSAAFAVKICMSSSPLCFPVDSWLLFSVLIVYLPCNEGSASVIHILVLEF